MADLDRLLEEFTADYEAGRAVDPAALLDRVGTDQRQELAARLDSYLMTAPTRRWDPEAYESSLAKVAVDRVYESIEGVSGSWPELLPALRKQAQVKRDDLVVRLADALGFGERQQIERIGAYYNRMEHGLLPATGVSRRVIDALATIVGVEPERVRAAGARGGAESGPAQTAFARTAFPNVEFAEEPIRRAAQDSPGEPEPADRDEIDALFLDG